MHISTHTPRAQKHTHTHTQREREREREREHVPLQPFRMWACVFVCVCECVCEFVCVFVCIYIWAGGHMYIRTQHLDAHTSRSTRIHDVLCEYAPHLFCTSPLSLAAASPLSLPLLLSHTSQTGASTEDNGVAFKGVARRQDTLKKKK